MLNVNRYNLFKSVETPTSGDHVEHSFFLSSSFPPHPQEVQFIPWPMAFSLLWWTAASLPRQAASSPMKGFLPCVPLMKGLSLTLTNGPPLDKWLPQWISSSQPPPYLNEQSPPSPLPRQTVSSFLWQMTSLDGQPRLVRRCCLRFMIRRWELGLEVVGSSYIWQSVGLGSTWFDIVNTVCVTWGCNEKYMTNIHHSNDLSMTRMRLLYDYSITVFWLLFDYERTMKRWLHDYQMTMSYILLASGDKTTRLHTTRQSQLEVKNL